MKEKCILTSEKKLLGSVFVNLKTTDIRENYELGKMIGEGAFG